MYLSDKIAELKTITQVGGEMMNKGQVLQVMGPVIDVKFANGQLPEYL